MISLLMLIALSSMNDSLPPVNYQNNAQPTVVITVDDTNTKENCGVAPKGWRILACEFSEKKVPIIIAPNPCTFPEAADENSYAHLMCHEFGHVNGWNADHNN